MNALRERWEQWRERFDALAKRERGLFFGAVVIALLLGGWQFLLTPLLDERETLQDRIASQKEELQALQRQRDSLSTELAEDPNEQLRQRAEQLSQRLERLDRDLEELTTGLISPQGMVALLREMLAEHEGVRLVAVSHQDPRAVSVSGEAPVGDDQPTGLFAHGVRVTVKGEFGDVFAYLQALENLDERLGWRALTYEVENWPRARVEISLQTLSLYEEWLGV